MSWLSKLFETYELGVVRDLPMDERLMPISHTLQNAHINIIIDGEGNFQRARVLNKMQVILPSTESSASRSSGEAPHPLADKLQYVAKDYMTFGGSKTAYFEGYRLQLLNWCQSKFVNPKVLAVYRYIEKGHVIADLIKSGIIHIDESNILLTTWNKADASNDKIEAPELIKILPRNKGIFDQGDALVCWTVEIDGDPESDTWIDRQIQQNWVDYDASTSTINGICYVTGRYGRLALNNPAKLRHTGDKAKLVSANDLEGFTFRGRFSDSKASIQASGYQSLGLGFDTSQKAHNALRWLISRQGIRNNDQVIIAWATSCQIVPDPTTNPLIDWDDLDEIETNSIMEESDDIDHGRDFGQSFAIKLKKKIAGYRAQFSKDESIQTLIIDSATPGRMAITHYREYFAFDFFARVEAWHLDFSWHIQHTVNKRSTDEKNDKGEVIDLISAPPPYAIANASYGKLVAENLKKKLYERLMACIFDAQAIPIDIIRSCIVRASNRNLKRLSDQYSNPASEFAEWEKDLGVTCALYRGFFNRHPEVNKRRNYSMTLETDYSSRDYVYGRLLAIADYIEEKALSIAKENRPTSASRLMQRFADQPAATWLTIHNGLIPYQHRIRSKWPGMESGLKCLMEDVHELILVNDFNSNEKLSGEYLLGFHCQRKWLREHKLQKGMWVLKSDSADESMNLTENELNEGDDE